jgi:type II secretory pathway component GspD/PulD (secretin)
MKKKARKTIQILMGVCLVALFCFHVVLTAEQNKFIKSLSLQNADIHSVMSFLADYGNTNIVVSPNVTGNVSLTLSNVTWKQALDIILKTYNLTGVEDEGYVRVLPTKDYMEEQTALEKHKFDQKTLVGLGTEIIPIRNATAKDLVKAVKTLVSDRGLVDTDDRTNSLIIRDIPENIKKVKEMVTSLDKETDQIRISAQLLEVDASTIQELGINWSVIPKNIKNSTAQIEQKADLVSSDVSRFTYSTIQNDFDLNAVITALETTNKGRVVAHPEVTTVDNKEAYIQMGSKIPVKQFDASGNLAITLYDVGTILRATPHITSENRILMKLKPERSSYQFDPNGVIINTNNAETNVVVDNGQTVVIGGLTTQEEQKIHTGIPILKDIPILGYLFRYTKKQVITKDLVIFVTPTIVTQEMKSMGQTLEPPKSSGN